MSDQSTQFLCLLKEAAEGHGVYPVEAYGFVLQGLGQAVERIYGKGADGPQRKDITGSQLCHELQELAMERWGMLAEVVLQKWNITATLDFGRIVFVLVEKEFLKTTDRDTLDEYRDVFEFPIAFENYQIPAKA